MAIRVHAPDRFGDPRAEAKRRVHRHGDSNKACATDRSLVKILDRNVHGRRGIPGLLKKPQRLSDAYRLMAKFVTGDQQNGTSLPE